MYTDVHDCHSLMNSCKSARRLPTFTPCDMVEPWENTLHLEIWVIHSWWERKIWSGRGPACGMIAAETPEVWQRSRDQHWWLYITQHSPQHECVCVCVAGRHTDPPPVNFHQCRWSIALFLWAKVTAWPTASAGFNSYTCHLYLVQCSSQHPRWRTVTKSGNLLQ